MNVLVIYDSMYGNTEKIARSIADAIGGDVKVVRAGDVKPRDMDSIGVLIVGSPTQGFLATKPVQAFIESIPADGLKGIKLTAFDTRMSTSDVGAGLKLIMKMGGYAAGRIAEALRKKGGTIVVPAEGFFVKDKEGPLKEGELERAAAWAKEIVSK